MRCCLCLEKMEPWVRKRTRVQLACGHTVHPSCWDGPDCDLCSTNDREMQRQVVSFVAGACMGIVSLAVSVTALVVAAKVL